MVAPSDIEKARSEFREWFLAEAERVGAVGRGKIAVLYRKLQTAARPGERPLVTQQQLRKYFSGENFPRPTVLKELCRQLNFQPPPAHFARMLDIRPSRPAPDPILEQLHVVWKQISDISIRKEILDFARFKAGAAARGTRPTIKSGTGG